MGPLKKKGRQVGAAGKSDGVPGNSLGGLGVGGGSTGQK